MGGAFGFNHYASDFSRNAGSSDINDYAWMLFGSYYFRDKYYVDATLRSSYLETDNVKRVPNFDNGPAFAPQKSDPNGWTISSDIGVGAELSRGALLLNPYARLGVYHTSIEKFRERGGDGSLSLSFDEQQVSSLPLTLGATAVYYVSTPAGVIAPYVRIQYLHEFLDQATSAKGFLTVIPDARFSIDPNSTDRDYGSVGIGASMTLKLGWSGFVDYDTLVGFSALESHALTFGVRKQL